MGGSLNQSSRSASLLVTSNDMKLQSKRFNQTAAWLLFVPLSCGKIIKEDSLSSKQDKYQGKLLTEKDITSEIHVKNNNYDRADMLEKKKQVTRAFAVLSSMSTFKIFHSRGYRQLYLKSFDLITFHENYSSECSQINEILLRGFITDDSHL